MLFSGRRCLRRQRGVCGDFVNFVIYRLNPSDVLIGIGFAYVCSYFIEMSVRALCVTRRLTHVITAALHISCTVGMQFFL